MKTNDVDLINSILDGNEKAFATLVQKYQKQVHALAWRKTGDFHIAEEITQDTFLLVYQKLSTLKDHNQFPGWLYVIATNRCKAWHRKKRLDAESIDDIDSEMIEDSAYSRYVANEKANISIENQREVVQKLLSKLKESERTVMILHYFGEMTCSEISRFLGVSPSAIKSRLSRARQRLKKEEPMIREALDNFQISGNLTENIMREIANLAPTTPSGHTPFLPWIAAASGVIMIAVLIGIGSQKLKRFQQPYNLNAQSEITVELAETPFNHKVDTKPIEKNLIESNPDGNGNSHGGGQEMDQDIGDKSDYTQWKLPEGVKARLGKGNITGNIAFSTDNTTLAVAGCAGIWLYDVRPGKEKEIDLLIAHNSKVTCLAFSPDGKYLASGNLDNNVHLWETKTGQKIDTLTGHNSEVSAIAFSPDGKTMATGSYTWDANYIEPEIRLWNIQTKSHISTLKGHKGTINSVAFSPDGNTLASGSSDETVRLWNTQTGELKETYDDHRGAVHCVAYASDGNILAFSYRNTVRMIGRRTDTFNITVPPNGRTEVFDIDFSPDDTMIATAHHDVVHLWDTETGKHKSTFNVKKKDVRSIAYSPSPSIAYASDGKTLATTGTDHIVQLWDIDTGKRRKTFKGHTGTFTSLAYSPNGNTLVTGTRRGVGFLWNAQTSQLIAKLVGHTSHISAITYASDENLVATAGRDGTVRLWNVSRDDNKRSNIKHKEILISHPEELRAMSYSPDGKTIVTGGVHGIACLWNAETGKMIGQLKEHAGTIKNVAFSHDSTMLACAGDDKDIRIWNVETHELITTLQGHTHGPNYVSFSADSTLLVSGASDDKTVRIWDVQTGEQRIEIKPEPRILSVGFTPNGNQVLTCGGHRVQFWDVHTGELIDTRLGHTGNVSSVVYSQDGRTMVSAAHDGTVFVW